MNYVLVTLLSMKGSKLSCVKAVRNHTQGVDLVLAKAICESLPKLVSVEADMIDQFHELFTLEMGENDLSSVLVDLEVRWESLSQARKVALLQYLDAVGMLQE